MRVSIGNEEANENVEEESDLAGTVEEEQILRQTSEEGELQRSEERRVHSPYQNELFPCNVQPIFRMNNICRGKMASPPMIADTGGDIPAGIAVAVIDEILAGEANISQESEGIFAGNC